MAKLVSLLISVRQQQIIGIMLGVLIFAVLLLGAGAVALHEVRDEMLAQSRQALQPYVQLNRDLRAAFAEIETRVTAAPCSPAFQTQLRQVAFLPDGFNEFLYVPSGKVQCSINLASFDPPIPLGQPDVPAHQADGMSLWIDRGLAFAGLDGLVGSIVVENDFGIVVPLQRQMAQPPAWLGIQTIFKAPSGRWWHRGGERGLYERARAAERAPSSSLLPSLRHVVCEGFYCAVTETSLSALLAHRSTEVGAAVALLLAASVWLASRAKAQIVRRWSFEARFRRHLDAESVICVYQPIMDLKTGRIAGCEVLARWRDVDDTVVYPDRFIPLVEQHGLTQKFTRMVVERAHRELSALPPHLRLHVTFNVFPRDLDSTVLLPIFQVFAAAPQRFSLVVEIVESDALEIEHAQRQIEALRAAGIRTYIDDFGTGYSNMQNLAALSVDGVKLDRAFAMAPAGTLMARMLDHAIGMIHASGRAMVVEGVETAERLALLRSITPAIDYAQGYYISRPLDITRFADFLERHGVAEEAGAALAA